MIGALRGVVSFRNSRLVTLDVNGVGYEVYCSNSVLDSISTSELEVIIFTDVKEDSITLYGFKDRLEKQVFVLLKKVKGVGSRIASDIVSAIDRLELLRTIGSGDSTKLQSIRGIGKKLSERIVLELKEVVAEYALGLKSENLKVEVIRIDPLKDAIEALRSLGFSSTDAERAIQKLQSDPRIKSMDSGELVREALRFV